MASPTPNLALTYPAHGAAVNAWDTPLNADFDTLDSAIGGTYSFSGAGGSAGSTLTQTQANNKRITITGILTVQNYLITFPAIGGLWVIDNQTTGAFTVSVKTSASAVAAIVCTQGNHTLVSSNGTDMSLADDAAQSAQAEFYTYLGNPNTNVAGTAGASNGDLTNAIWDKTNQQIYVATTTGVAADAVWTPTLARTIPQGYLSGVSSTTSPIITSDTTATTIYYTPYVGAWTVLSNGTALYPYTFSQMSLTLTASQAANQIYDIFMYANPTSGIISPIIGTGPAWTTATAGSCARGTGAGTSELTRLNGVLVNNVQVSLLNGATTYVCPASQGIYLGSIFVDSAAGNVTCNTSWGQSRKWGIWNAYNRTPIRLQAGDSTASWTYATTAVWRPSNNSANNKVTIFSGLPEEYPSLTFTQYITAGDIAMGSRLGIGYNSVAAPSGTIGAQATTTANTGFSPTAQYEPVPSIGINTANCLEYTFNGNGSNTPSYNGTQLYMLLSARWRA